MNLKSTPILESPKSADITFKVPTSGAFSKVSEVSPGVHASFEKLVNGKKEPITSVSDGANSLEWGMKCPFASSCLPDKTLSGVQLSQSLCVCAKTCDKLTVQIEARQGKVKEIITLNEKPDTNVFTFAVNSNLTPKIIDIETAPDVINEGLSVLWLDSEGVARREWDRILCTDSNGFKFYGKYLPALTGKNLRIEISQADIDIAVFPIEIDPTTNIISSTTLSYSTYRRGKLGVYTGSEYVVAFPTASGTSGITMVSTDKITWSDVTVDNPLAAADYKNVVVLKFEDGDQLILGGNGTGIRSVKRTNAGVFDSSATVVVASGVDYGFDAAIDENGYVYVICREYSVWKFWKSEDRGATWSVLSVSGITLGFRFTFSYFGLAATGDGKLHLISVPALINNGPVNHIIYTTSSDTWSGNNVVLNGAKQGAPVVIPLLVDSVGDLHFAIYNGALFRTEYWKYSSGSWALVTTSALLSSTTSNPLSMITSNDEFLLTQDSDNPVPRHVWISGAWETLPLLPIAHTLWSCYRSGLINHGEPTWYLSTVAAGDTYFLEDETYNYPGGGGNGGIPTHIIQPGIRPGIQPGVM